MCNTVLHPTPHQVLVPQSCPIHCDPKDCSPEGSSAHGILQERILELVTSHSLLQGIFSTQGLNPGLLPCRWILYHLSQNGWQYSSKNLLSDHPSI